MAWVGNLLQMQVRQVIPSRSIPVKLIVHIIVHETLLLEGKNNVTKIVMEAVTEIRVMGLRNNGNELMKS